MPDRKGLLNYTTSIDADKTVTEIVLMLRRHGARSIMTDYNEFGGPSGLSFKVARGQDLAFQLPANVEQILRKLIEQADAKQIERRYANQAQAERVAWRILKDWVEAQMAIIDTGMVEMEEVFLSYLLVDGEHRFYEQVRDRGYLLPAPRGDR